MTEKELIKELHKLHKFIFKCEERIKMIYMQLQEHKNDKEFIEKIKQQDD